MNRLEYYRTRADLTQSELARKTGVDQGKISRTEKGIVDLYGQQWRALADVLGCTVDELVGR